MKRFMRLTSLFVFLLFVGVSENRVYADDNIFPPAPAAASAVSFDGRGFLIHGKHPGGVTLAVETVASRIVAAAEYRDDRLSD